jgi:maleylacetoacetate isomerase
MADPAKGLVLYGYWRSSSAYRVRIALNLKGLEYRQEHVHLVRDGGEQHAPEYRALNPLGLVPALVDGTNVIVQSLAICEYLEETQAGMALLPGEAAGRAWVRSFVQTVSSEIQPLNNLGVMNYLKDELGQQPEAVRLWYRHWVERGFIALETWLNQAASGDYCFGNHPTLADCFLVPQVYNAERFKCDLGNYPRIREVTERCRALDAFRAAAPENQPDAE